jgi:hypothetical protein
VIALASLMFTALVVILGVMVRILMKWTRMEDKLAEVSRDITDLVKDKDKTHAEMIHSMREDRAATNERLTYLERSVWPRVGREKV